MGGAGEYVTYDFPVRGGPGTVGIRRNSGFSAAGDDVRPMLDARDVQPSARASSMAVYQDHHAVDAVAGSEMSMIESGP